MVQSAYRGAASRQGWTTEADLLDGQRTDATEVSTLIAAPASRILVGEQGDALLATAHLKQHDGVCHFGMFAVRPGLQGHGLGRRILAEAERIACEDWNCREMQMLVITLRSELIAWYERRGYRRAGTYKPFPYGDVRFGIPKRNDLQLEVLSKSIVR